MNHSRAPSGHRPWRRDTDAVRADDDKPDEGDRRDDNKDDGRDKEGDNDAVEDAVMGFGQAIRGIHRFPELQQACHILQCLTEAPPLLSPAAQREASASLLYLSSQLLQTPDPSNSSHPGASTATAATALFQAFSNILMALDSTTGPPGSALEQALEDTLAALPLVQTMLWYNHNTGTPVTVSTPTVATQLSSCGITCLPLSSHRLAQPRLLDVTFPTASVLATFLPAHPDVQLQLTVLALNPFKHLDRTEISSVGGVSLTSAHGALDVHGLREEIEVGLWRDEAVAPVPTCLNLSAQHFHMELNLTSAKDALLVHVQPDAPLPVDLYLGFGHPPNRTHFLFSTTLPRGRSPPHGDTYTWALPPERLWPGPGRYHLMAVVAWSPEQGPVGVSVTTATTRCYFWDQSQRAWATGGCQVGPSSNMSSTRCLCNHLSFFGSSFLVVPRTVRLQDAGQLLARMPSNPVGAALLGSLLLAFGLAGLWAWRSDRADARQVGRPGRAARRELP
ncbi:polycystic kidney disease protein 1-like 3 [Alligator mississippiensis]|uniref:Polycystic kidney disease protein 1-like 3 n=1 Tax=Alligator mississippiensis TaxID=8496 RepID=A0A151NNY5_ALLMI|nr:polycystic kidney disease protein 1-like 3 [Alligator mississippiensis]